MRILLIEDVKKLASFIKKGLESASYSVDCAYAGQDGASMAMMGDFDLIILDIMLPQKNGFEVCRELRQNNISTPILMLTAKGETEDRVTGLNCGADDYLPKPFDFKELLARIRALLRRPETFLPVIQIVGDIAIDTSTRTVKRGEDILTLSAKEYALLDYMVRNKNIVLSRNQILDGCWDWSDDRLSNIVDAYIMKLRRKLSPEDHEKYIKTVRGVGYAIQG